MRIQAGSGPIVQCADATSIKEVVPTREDDVWRGGPSPTKGSFNVHANPKMNRRSIDYGITKQQSLIIVPTCCLSFELALLPRSLIS